MVSAKKGQGVTADWVTAERFRVPDPSEAQEVFAEMLKSNVQPDGRTDVGSFMLQLCVEEAHQEDCKKAQEGTRH